MTSALWAVTEYFDGFALIASIRLRSVAMKLHKAVVKTPIAAPTGIKNQLNNERSLAAETSSREGVPHRVLTIAAGLAALLVLTVAPAIALFSFAFFEGGGDAAAGAEMTVYVIEDPSPAFAEYPLEINDLEYLPAGKLPSPEQFPAVGIRAEDAAATEIIRAEGFGQNSAGLVHDRQDVADTAEAEHESVPGEDTELIGVLENILMDRYVWTEETEQLFQRIISEYLPAGETAAGSLKTEQETKTVLSIHMATNAEAESLPSLSGVDPALVLKTIPYSTVYIEDVLLLEGETRVVVTGRDGYVLAAKAGEMPAGEEYTGEDVSISREESATHEESAVREYRVFGEESANRKLSVIEPVTEIIAVGTAPRPSERPDGSYIWPADGTITSWYGPRVTDIGSTNHKGIDISASYGHPILAADGGEVIFSGYDSDYGYVVRIRHDNGDVTVYAHCSSLVAGTGAHVARGQEIARMGSTGLSSGVHLHFELLIDGNNVNPLPYLP